MTNQPAPYADPSRPKRRVFKWTSAIAVLIILLIGGAFLYDRFFNRTDEESSLNAHETSNPGVQRSASVQFPIEEKEATGDDQPVTTESRSGTNTAITLTNLDRQLFTFSLDECRLAGTIVTCQITITNRDKDRALRFYTSRIRLFDHAGDVYECLRAEFPNREMETVLVAGIPTRVTLTFEGIQSQVRRLSRLVVAFYADQSCKVEFKNIDLIGS